MKTFADVPKCGYRLPMGRASRFVESGGDVRLAIRVIGVVLIGLILIGLGLSVLLALMRGQAFYGRNYKMLDLPTYSVALCLVVIALIGVAHAIRWLVRYRRGRRK